MKNVGALVTSVEHNAGLSETGQSCPNIRVKCTYLDIHNILSNYVKFLNNLNVTDL